MSSVRNENDHSEVVIVGELYTPTDTEKVLFDWYDKAPIRALENTQAALVRMVTLASAFSSGGVAFLRQAIGKDFQIVVVVLMLTSLVFAVIGSTPRVTRIASCYVSAFDAAMASVTERKMAWLTASMFFMLAGLGVSAIGMYLS